MLFLSAAGATPISSGCGGEGEPRSPAPPSANDAVDIYIDTGAIRRLRMTLTLEGPESVIDHSFAALAVSLEGSPAARRVGVSLRSGSLELSEVVTPMEIASLDFGDLLTEVPSATELEVELSFIAGPPGTVRVIGFAEVVVEEPTETEMLVEFEELP